MMASIKRKIMFYNVEIGRISGQEMNIIDDVNEIENIMLNGDRIIRNLPFDLNAINSRYLCKDNNNDLSMYIDSFQNGIIEGRIVLCRRSLLPSIESQGMLSDLEIDENAGIAEITHFKYFVRDKILGVEYNFHGPKSTQIAEYFQQKLQNIIQMFNIHTISDNSWSRLLEDDRYQITMFSFKATRSASDILNQLNSGLGQAFDAIASINNVEEIELIIRKKSRTNGCIEASNFNLRNFFENNFIHRQEFDKLKIGIRTDEGNKEINLLEDRLCISKTVELMTGRSRTVLSTSIYSKIQEAFDELRDQLVIRV